MATDRLFFTGDDEADRLLVSSPLALLIGFVLDQQVTVQKAFSGPLELQRRAGNLDAKKLAAMSEEDFAAHFTEKPSLHRFPANMAKRAHALVRAIADDYDGDASKVWTEAKDGADLERRIAALPGFGDMKIKSLIAVLGKQLGAGPKDWKTVAPDWPTLGDVDSPEALANYQSWKRAGKAEAKESGTTFDPAKAKP